MAVAFLIAEPVKCGRKRCGAVAHVAPEGNRRFVIECSRCQVFVRANSPSEAEALWRNKSDDAA